MNRLKEKVSAPLTDKDNYGKMLLVTGEEGVGKTRLFVEFRKFCQLQNYVFLEGELDPKIKKSYGPFIEIINELLYHIPFDLIEKYGPEIKKILPHHEKLKGIDTIPSMSPNAEKWYLIDKMINLIMDYAKRNSKLILYLFTK